MDMYLKNADFTGDFPTKKAVLGSTQLETVWPRFWPEWPEADRQLGMNKGGDFMPTGGHRLRRTALTGWEVTFFCDICGGAVRVEVHGAASRDAALEKGWALARFSFNCCGYCGKWHCDACHDLQSMLCKGCAPHVRDGPEPHLLPPAKMCPACGNGNRGTHRFCTNCGTKLTI